MDTTITNMTRMTNHEVSSLPLFLSGRRRTTLFPMKLLLLSGLLYLTGVSIVLYYKPQLMFTTEGEWKEFGLGRNPAQYTWLPFWLFTLLWAMLSYLIVLTLLSPSPSLASSSLASSSLAPSSLAPSFFSDAPEVPLSMEELGPENISTKSLPSSLKKRPTTTGEMKKGYYILDANETARRGIPKYIYLGPEAPQLAFQSQTVDA